MSDSQDLFSQAVGLFNRGEFYDCHEVFEQIWTSSKNPERQFLQSLIHFAVGLHHYRHNNNIGAIRQLGKGLQKIHNYLPRWGGIITITIKRDMQKCLNIIESGGKINLLPTVKQVEPYNPDRS